MKIENLTKDFVKQNHEEAWEVIKLRRNINKLTNHDFTPFKYKSRYLNVKNLQEYLLPLILNYKINSTNFVLYAGFNNIVYTCKAFFVLSPEQIAKHFIKIKKIILQDIIPQCDEITKEKVYRCLTDLRSIAIDYKIAHDEITLR